MKKVIDADKLNKDIFMLPILPNGSAVEVCNIVECRNLFKAMLEMQPNVKFTNSEWIDFLSEQFDISRTSAKEMLHVMMSVKKEDNLKKQFNQPRKVRNNMANEQISKIESEYLVMDEDGYTDKKLVDTVNRLVDKVNELNAQMKHKAKREDK